MRTESPFAQPVTHVHPGLHDADSIRGNKKSATRCKVLTEAGVAHVLSTCGTEEAEKEEKKERILQLTTNSREQGVHMHTTCRTG